jgi:phosphomannomutase
MNKVYIFDVDGTLTPSRQTMTKEFLEFFNGWSKSNPFYLVTGSDLPKMKEQVPDFILERAEAIFTCCGNQMWKDNELIYENKFKPPETLLTYLGFQTKISDTPVKSTNHREDRGAMINFSTVGRDCTLEERQQYFEWDSEVGERKKIAEEVMRGWPDLDAVIGGQISIDIYPKGRDKSQILEHIEKNHSKGEIIFIGDGIENGGNDYPLAHLMDNITDCDWYHTKGWKQTKEILEKLSND